MYAHLLVSLDGSERAERALPVAAHIARASGVRITLLQALPVYRLAGTLYDGAWMTASQIAAQQTAATGYLAEVSRRPLLTGLPVETQISTQTPAAAILDAALAGHVALIVLCSHGRSGVSRWVLGSVAEHVTRHAAAPVPVLVLRQGGPIPARPHPDPEHLTRILVPLDGSALAEAAVDTAAALILALAGPHGAALHLTVVLNPLEADPEYMLEGLALVGARTYLTHIVDHLRSVYPLLTVTWSVASGFDVADTLLHVAETGEDAGGAGPSSRCDLIALAMHGRTGPARWALGSITERVLHASTLPLLVVRPPQLAHPEHAKQGQPVAATGSPG